MIKPKRIRIEINSYIFNIESFLKNVFYSSLLKSIEMMKFKVKFELFVH
jgi:hypothetical protein